MTVTELSVVAAPRAAPVRPPTFGVEEEFATLDPSSGETALLAAEVIDGCHDLHRVVAESMAYMVETRTPVCRSLDEVSRSINTLRRRVAAEARRRGVVAVASGVAPYGVPDPPPVTEDPRYYTLAATYPHAMSTTGTCGCHVHVAIPNREAGVEVLRRIRRWLPALTAFGTNSPIWEGRDAGWASLRYVFASRWPTSVPVPPVETPAEYDAAVARAVASGDALDVRSVYFVARLSPRHPTVEVRIADAFLTADETVAYAGLVRAMVARALSEASRGLQVEYIPQGALVAACRDAALAGMGGTLTDVATGRHVPAWELVDDVVGYALPYLQRYGDTSRVLTTLYRARLAGSGAERQRRMFERACSAEEFVRALAGAATEGIPTVAA